MNVYDFKLPTIEGQERALADYRGDVLLIVNTASECGFTPQYAGLEKLYGTNQNRGFLVLGFPSNDFGQQEPGTAEEIKTFCSVRYGVTFPLFSKITVKGPSKHPLYQYLTSAVAAGEVKWNFEKFLVGKDGNVIARYPSSVTPDDPKLLADIERALGT